jgi:hypothetical protein
MTQTTHPIHITEFQAINPLVQVNGTTILSTIEGSAIKDLTKKILAEVGLPANPEPDQWYPQQKWLDVLKKIQDKYGAANLKMIGKKIPETANFPPQINSIETGLESIGVAHRMNHRGGEIGYYRFEKTSENEGFVEANNPYPCDFNMGIVIGMAKRFVPTAFVSHEAGSCRKAGGAVCRYHIHW